MRSRRAEVARAAAGTALVLLFLFIAFGIFFFDAVIVILNRVFQALSWIGG